MTASIIDPDAFLQTDKGRVWTPERSAAAWQSAFAALNSAVAECPHAHVVVVIGLQGSGKSTWIRQQANLSGRIYFDAALPGRKHRKPIIDIALHHGATIEAIWIDVPLSIALTRNAGRPADQIVPEDSIRSVAALFERPTTDEGFHVVTIIRP
jgi:predicted kinase